MLKAPAVLSLGDLLSVLPQGRAGSWLVPQEQAMGSGLGRPATTPGPFSSVPSVDLLFGYPP